ncbi:MAG: peptidylprolyl isomerase [Gammaproteobacteria bacterium]
MHNITRHLLTFTLLFSLATMSVSALADNPKVKMDTDKGTVIIELYPDKAPDTVKNFLRYVEAGKYDGTLFHRVIKGFMNQGGGFDREYKKVDTFSPIINEADNGLKNTRGTIAMARTNDPNSATNQFFINTVDNHMLNHTNKSVRGWGYCVFGKVVEGMDVMDRISQVKTGAAGPFPSDVPAEPLAIQKVTLIQAEADDGKATSKE